MRLLFLGGGGGGDPRVPKDKIIREEFGEYEFLACAVLKVYG